MEQKLKSNVDLTRNEKQASFFLKAMAASQNKNLFKFLFYGGGIRGGKTFVILFILSRLCVIFPNSRWCIVRKDMPSIESTTVPSFEKIIAGSNKWKWYRDKSNYHVTHDNGSKIFFRGENITIDPFLNKFLGLEVNGFFLEQMEELSEKMLEKAIERCGSWYIDKMPRGLIFGSFNPTQCWLKKRFYDKYVDGTLEPNVLFQEALPSDNPFVTQDQFEGWDMMAERYKKQFIHGSWDDFDSEDGRWLFAFNRRKHVGKVEWNEKEITYLSFDFNRDPMTCGVWQIIDGVIYGVRSIKLPDATVYRMCDKILEYYPNAFFIVNGDASGQSRSTVNILDNYKIIKNMLNLSKGQIQVSGSNPPLKDSRVMCNSILEIMPFVVDEVNCKDFIDDAEQCKANADNTIVKDNRNKEAQKADTLDNTRYFLHANFRNIFRNQQ